VGSSARHGDLGGDALIRGGAWTAGHSARVARLPFFFVALALGACAPPVSYHGDLVPAVLAPAPPRDARPTDPVPLSGEDSDPLAGGIRLIRADRAVASPAFDFVDEAGVRHTPAELAGRVVWIDVWATWCAACRAEFPDLQRLHEHHAAAGLVVLAVCRNSKRDDFEKAVRKSWIRFATVDAGDAGDFPFPVGAFPTSVVLDREGRVRAFWQGWRPPEAGEELVRRLLAEPAPGSGSS
jgi:thiol-disulfide isomerase/thioredoxin